MYLSLSVRYAQFDRVDPTTIIQFYRIHDTMFDRSFSASYIRNKDGTLNDVHHLDQLLRSIYYTYKYSNQPVCKNFKQVIKNTFSAAESQIKQTAFYKENKVFVDRSLEGIANVSKY